VHGSLALIDYCAGEATVRDGEVTVPPNMKKLDKFNMYYFEPSRFAGMAGEAGDGDAGRIADATGGRFAVEAGRSGDDAQIVVKLVASRQQPDPVPETVSRTSIPQIGLNHPVFQQPRPACRTARRRVGFRDSTW